MLKVILFLCSILLWNGHKSLYTHTHASIYWLTILSNCFMEINSMASLMLGKYSITELYLQPLKCIFQITLKIILHLFFIDLFGACV